MRTPRMPAPAAALAAAALAIGLVACNATPAGPGTDDIDQMGAIFAAEAGDADPRVAGRTRSTRGGGSVFQRLDALIDGFAGVYRVAQCSVVLVLTDAADVDEAVRIVHAVIEPLVARTCPTGIRVTPERGTYTYSELHRYHAVALPLVGARGVYAAVVSYPLNAVLITVASRETARRVLGSLTDDGVPEGAIAFRIRAR